MALRVLFGGDSGPSSGGLFSLSARPARELWGSPRPATGPARGLPRSGAHAILRPELCGPDRDDVRARRNRILGRGLSKVSGTTSLRHTNLWSHYRRHWSHLDPGRRMAWRSTPNQNIGLVLSRLWLRDVTRVPAFHCDALYPVSPSVVADGRLGLLYVSEYRSVEHRPGECCTTKSPGNRLRAQHSRHSRTWGRASLSHHRLHCRAYELDDRVSLRLGNDARFRTPLVDRNEISRGGYLAGRAGSTRLMSS